MWSLGDVLLFCILIVSAASSGSGRLQIALNLDLRDGTEETAMGLALWTGQFDVARELLEAGKLFNRYVLHLSRLV